MQAATWQRLDAAVTLLHAFVIRRKVRAARREGLPITLGWLLGRRPRLLAAPIAEGTLLGDITCR